MTKRIFSWALAVMIAGSGAYGAVSDHILSIEISTTYDYDFPDVTLHYDFDAVIQVDATVVSGNMQVPSGNVYAMDLENNGDEIKLSFDITGADLTALDDFGAGTYTFTVNYVVVLCNFIKDL